MKRFSSILVLLCIAVSLFATDIIILKNSTRIDAVIQEVSQNEVKYKKASSPNGPSFILSTSEIVSIVYDNGEVQTFDNNSQQQSYDNQQQSYDNQQQSYNNQQQSYNNNRQSNKPKNSTFVLRDAENWYSFTINYSYYKPKEDAKEDADKKKTMNGFNAGFMMQNKLYKNLVLLCGLEYQFAMSKKKEDGATDKWMNHNIKVPLRFGFSMPFAKKSSATIFFGPSFDFNVATINKYEEDGFKTEINYVNGKYKFDMEGEKESGSDSEFKTMKFFDLPLGIGIIYKYSHLGIKLQYEWGLLNRSKEDGSKFKADQLTVGLIFSF